MNKIYKATLLKLSSVSPMFGKVLLDNALSSIKKTPDDVTASEVLYLLKNVINPQLSGKNQDIKTNAILRAGTGLITTNYKNDVIYMNTYATKIFEDELKRIGRDITPFDFFYKTGLSIPIEKASSILVQEIKMQNSTYSVTISPIYNEEGSLTGVNSTFNDITLLNELEIESLEHLRNLQKEIKQRKKIERELLEGQEKMVNSSKLAALGEMGAGIAHEINNPLGIIKLNNLLIKRSIEKDKLSETKLLEFIKTTDSSIERITKIIKSMRNLSRKTEHLDFIDTKIEDIINEVLPLCENRFKDSNVKLTIDISQEHLNLKTKSKIIEISQVIINLLNNAFDAIRENDNKWVILTAKPNGNYIIISIIDSGIGIPKNLHDKIFEPFFSTKEIGKGTGLGVSVSKKIVENHGGQLTIDNEHPNTKFDIILPLSL